MCLRFSALGVMPRRTSWLINALNNCTSKIVSGQQHISDCTGMVTQMWRLMVLGLGHAITAEHTKADVSLAIVKHRHHHQ